MMDPIDLVLAIIYFAGGKIDGRTKIQKIAYFINEKFDCKITFIPHYYGPYSTSIAKTLEDLVATDFVEEEALITLNDRKFFMYRIKDGVKNILEQNKELYKFKTLVERLANENLNNVINASKVHYLYKNSNNKDSNFLIEEAKKYGWNLSQNEVNDSLILLNELELI
ncbi:MAG: hypothetical protein H5T50_05555 [Nitrososphaeria archaeon]|nr:hypothetical protein [Nitrososphaeria archaeon]